MEYEIDTEAEMLRVRQARHLRRAVQTGRRGRNEANRASRARAAAEGRHALSIPESEEG